MLRTPAAASVSSNSSVHGSAGAGGSIEDEVAARLTPVRATRLDEKNELQSLNKRLEYYILVQRERDAGTAGVRAEVRCFGIL